ncbi:DUF4468 domain-containing protein [Ferruginibacter lapsinanis]|uniref:DUF4468 domain-containing protein n=1 Tax=Ferruginibacter lapsinanis TaxID=563172 RepID=UPI001E443F36|nr:DUF4468 domain-containing protein [Ferruginibacter lapsinanis]UEG50892.1 DUF4468 domain-containing protein [Ferruginibacter lapsinanis]
MKTFILIAIFLFTIQCTFAQDTLVTYTRPFNESSLNKNDLFDKALLWFTRSFYNSYDVIKVNNKAAGILTGKAFFYSSYKVPQKQDSTTGFDFTDYNFIWTMKITDNNVSFSISNLCINGGIPVTSAIESPFVILMQSSERSEQNWGLSKLYLMKNLDALLGKLNVELATR